MGFNQFVLVGVLSASVGGVLFRLGSRLLGFEVEPLQFSGEPRNILVLGTVILVVSTLARYGSSMRTH